MSSILLYTDDDVTPLLEENCHEDEPTPEIKTKCDVENLDEYKKFFRGYFIVIDNISRPKPNDKTNNSEDTTDPLNKQNIEHVFGKVFGFHVQYYTQLTVGAIKQLLEFVRLADHSKFTGLVIITLCRGYNSTIYCSEFNKTKEMISIDEISSYFSDENALLMDKPVIFLHDIWQQSQSMAHQSNTGEDRVDVSMISGLYRIVCHCPETLQNQNGISFFIKSLRQEASENTLLKDALEHTMFQVTSKHADVRPEGDMVPLSPLPKLTER